MSTFLCVQHNINDEENDDEGARERERERERVDRAYLTVVVWPSPRGRKLMGRAH